ncbi:MAG: phage tail protein [Cyanobacteria bacterium J06633_8]
MTQTPLTQVLNLQLTPMQISETIPVTDLSSKNSFATQTANRGTELFLYPGESSEILVEIENSGREALQLDLGIGGNFPENWCRIGIEGNELAPKQRIQAVLYFQTPDDFFEFNRPLTPGKSLVLDYSGHLNVRYNQTNSNRELIKTAEFKLYVRPRSLYPKFLPEFYREVDFISRLLKIFEETFEPAVNTLNSLWAYLDPLTAPEAMLGFLGNWVAWEINPRWSPEVQRRLIRQAMQIYSWRGTRRGLRFYLHLYTGLPLDEEIPQEDDKHISIQEVFQEGLVLGKTSLGDNTLMGGGKPYHFIVRLRSEPGIEIDGQLVDYIIEQEKPVFCTYELIIDR